MLRLNQFFDGVDGNHFDGALIGLGNLFLDYGSEPRCISRVQPEMRGLFHYIESKSKVSNVFRIVIGNHGTILNPGPSGSSKSFALVRKKWRTPAVYLLSAGVLGEPIVAGFWLGPESVFCVTDVSSLKRRKTVFLCDGSDDIEAATTDGINTAATGQ